MKSLNPKIKYFNHLGQTQQFEKYLCKKIWPHFYRFANCFLYNLHISSIINNFEQIKNLDLIFLNGGLDISDHPTLETILNVSKNQEVQV